MIEKQKIEELFEEHAKGSGLFLVSVKVSNSNRIIILADKNDGITIDECAAIHRYIENGLDRVKEDFELQVSSPGLDVPFTVIEQYYKNENRKVEVVDNDGSKYHRENLRMSQNGGFELETEIKTKGRTIELKDMSFNFRTNKINKSYFDN
jgi:ribosome maturation factor RimP